MTDSDRNSELHTQKNPKRPVLARKVVARDVRGAGEHLLPSHSPQACILLLSWEQAGPWMGFGVLGAL